MYVLSILYIMNGDDFRCMEGKEAQDVFDHHAKLSELLQAYVIFFYILSTHELCCCHVC